MLGILLIDKPIGCTSHDVVHRLRKKFGTKRVGHAGTLDPLATGLLVVAVGAATRFLQYLPLEPKEYRAEITFGQSSTTYDAEGELSDPSPVPEDLRQRLEALVPRYTGLIEQLPPAYSAVKVDGKPLYLYAREGVAAVRKPRTVHVGTLEFESFDGPVVRARIVCSGGTYVRTIADDLGREVGVGAYLSALRRTRAGAFSVEEAVSLNDVDPSAIRPLSQALPPMRLLSLDSGQTAAIRQGQRIGCGDSGLEGLVGLIDPSGEVFGVARVDGDSLQPEVVIPMEAAI